MNNQKLEATKGAFTFIASFHILNRMLEFFIETKWNRFLIKQNEGLLFTIKSKEIFRGVRYKCYQNENLVIDVIRKGLFSRQVSIQEMNIEKEFIIEKNKSGFFLKIEENNYRMIHQWFKKPMYIILKNDVPYGEVKSPFITGPERNYRINIFTADDNELLVLLFFVITECSIPIY